MGSLAGLPATRIDPEGPAQAPPALLVHGIGLGRWIFERTQRVLAEAGVPSVAIDLPGHGEDRASDVDLDRLIAAVEGAADALGECAIVGHSLGGYVAQIVASRRPLRALVLVGAVPNGASPYWPTRAGIRTGIRLAPALLARRPLSIPLADYLASGLGLAPSERHQEHYARITPWPARAVRGLVRRPHRVAAGGIACPVLNCIGRQDQVVRWEVGRRLGESLDALTWRYDDLGHLPTLQDGGERMERDIAAFLVKPRRRRLK